MKKVIHHIILLFLIISNVLATHNRAGEITFISLGNLTYQITVTTFTYSLSAADRSELIVEWGDNTYSVVLRNSQVELPDYYLKNTYVGYHTFPGPGEYEILVQDPNRNFGVQNIPNSVNVIFSIKTKLIINSVIGENSTPILLNDPIDKAFLNQIFIHNPAAFDSDGDSLAYKLTICTGEDGVPIEEYKFPAASDTLYVDPLTGDFVWDSPEQTGIYNVAMNIEEYREGIKVGTITRDMQIEVVESDNTPPLNPVLENFCVVAGDIIQTDITSTDADGDTLFQSAKGGPFNVIDSASFKLVLGGKGEITSRFRWETSCFHVRDEPYYVIIKTEDEFLERGSVPQSSFDLDNFTIQVLGPQVTNVTASPGVETINLNWNSIGCPNTSHYEIFRVKGIVNFQPDSCDNSIPYNLGFESVARTDNNGITNFADSKSEGGLEQGEVYSYIVVAVFENGTYGIPSESVFAKMIQRIPTLIKVSVSRFDESDGSIDIAWLKPTDTFLDSISFVEPYYYLVYRKLPSQVQFVAIDSNMNNINDTLFVDNQINTIEYPYTYKVNFVYTELNTGNLVEIEGSTASSTYINVLSSDNKNLLQFNKDAPWINIEDSVYFQTGLNEYKLIDVVLLDDQFLHEDLVNGLEYRYYISSVGELLYDSIIYKTHNISHPAVGVPLDTIPPCTPDLENIASYCSEFYNELGWSLPTFECEEDIMGYIIRYSNFENGMPTPVDTLFEPSARSWQHHLLDSFSLGGCYTISAFDSSGYESNQSVKLCIDSCVYYKLPNIFIPGSGSSLEIYYSWNPNNYIKKVDMNIFNRWGQLVYSTTNPDIAWDGRHKDTGKIVPSGVYYYICDIYEPRIIGEYKRVLTGFIHTYDNLRIE